MTVMISAVQFSNINIQTNRVITFRLHFMSSKQLNVNSLTFITLRNFRLNISIGRRVSPARCKMSLLFISIFKVNLLLSCYMKSIQSLSNSNLKCIERIIIDYYLWLCISVNALRFCSFYVIIIWLFNLMLPRLGS